MFFRGSEDPEAPAWEMAGQIRDVLARGGSSRFDARNFEGAVHGNLVWNLPVRAFPSFPDGYLTMQREWAQRVVGIR
jgi:hypothetical protein